MDQSPSKSGNPGDGAPTTGPVTFGSNMKSEFPFDPDWRNMNQGSYGSIPKTIFAQLRNYQDRAEARPDSFIRYEYPKLLDESRAAVAGLVNAPVETVVFVGNATEGVNTVFRNIAWADDGMDVIVTFSTVYESCGKVTDYLFDYYGGKVSTVEVEITSSLEDEEILSRFKDTVKGIESEGKRVRICIFDVVSSRPGIVFPWQAMTRVCADLGVLSMVDGAQSIGMVPLDLSAADPDFFVTNCHKWLHVPRGCALLYVPLRNQHLLPTTLATSHGYVAKTRVRTTPLPTNNKSPFVKNFEFVGTKDTAPYLCVKDAIAWREEVGGEDKIIAYLWDLNKKGSARVAEILGTEVLNNSKGTLTNCGMANVALPLWVGEAKAKGAVVSTNEANDVSQWMHKIMIDDYKTFVPFHVNGGRFWTRISAQVYLDLEDYENIGETLKELCERVSMGDYQK